jgi:hypothetical protein
MRLELYLLATGGLVLTAFAARPHAVGGQRTTPADAPAAAWGAGVVPEPMSKSAAAAALVDATAAARELRVAAVLDALSSRVARTSDPDALRDAFEAYYAFRAAQPERVRKPYLYFVDYGLDSRMPRGYVFDMESLSVVDGPFTVAHGWGSGPRDGVPTRFSNRSGSAASSLGLFLAAERYDFTGTTGGRHYASPGMRLDGVSGEFNSAARARGVVTHGAPYVTASGSGRSEGCPAMEPLRARRLIPLLADGSLVFLFSPRDTEWLHGDPWVNAR